MNVLPFEEKLKDIEYIYNTLKFRLKFITIKKPYNENVYLVGSLARSLKSKNGFTMFSDIDIWILPPVGMGTLTTYECRDIKRRLGNKIDEHPIHVFSPRGWLVMMTREDIEKGERVERIKLKIRGV